MAGIGLLMALVLLAALWAMLTHAASEDQMTAQRMIQGADRVSAPTRPAVRRKAGRAWARKRRSASVMPARVIKAAADVSPIDAFGGKATREHRIRVRSQQSERLHRVQRGARLTHEASASQSV